MECSATTVYVEPRNNEIDLIQSIMKSDSQDLPRPEWADSMFLQIENLGKEVLSIKKELEIANEFTRWTVNGWTVMQILKRAGKSNNLAMVQYCICTLEVDINKRESSSSSGLSLLDSLICNEEDLGDHDDHHIVLDWLLLHPKLNINSVTSDGYSALHRACEKGNVYGVQALLKAGADTNIFTHSLLKYKPIELVDRNTKSAEKILNIFEMHEQKNLSSSINNADSTLAIKINQIQQSFSFNPFEMFENL